MAAKLTVIVPLYNKASTIESTVDSLLAQTVSEWAAVMVDDGSTDDGPALVEALGDRRIALVRQANAGVSAARNRGIAAARTELVAFLDADDYWAPQHLANVLALVDAYPEAGLFATAYNVVYEDGEVRRVRVRDGAPARGLMADYFAETVDVEIPIQTSGVAVRKTALAEVGGFPIGVKVGEDLVTWSRLACRFPIAYSTDATTFYRAPPRGIDKRQRVSRRPEQPDYVGAALAELMEAHPERAASLARFRARWHRGCAIAHAEHGQPGAAMGHTRAAMRLDRLTLRDGITSVLSAVPGFARDRLFAWGRAYGKRRHNRVP